MLEHYKTKSGLVVKSDGFIVILEKACLDAENTALLMTELKKLPSRKHGKTTVYFFNESYDRECVEESRDRFSFNPSKAFDIFGELEKVIPNRIWYVGAVQYSVLETTNGCTVQVLKEGSKVAEFSVTMSLATKWIEALTKAKSHKDLRDVAVETGKKTCEVL